MEINVYYSNGKLIIDYPEQLTEAEALALIADHLKEGLESGF